MNKYLVGGGDSPIPRAEFPTGVENMGGSSKFDGGDLSQNMGGA